MVSRNQSCSSFNPWSASGSVTGIRLGDPHSGVVIARRHGFQPAEDQASERYSSVRMMGVMQEMSTLSSEIHQVELELHRQTLDRASADLMHLQTLRDRLSKTGELLDHFTQVVTNKETVVTRLQRVAADNSLVIEAPYQRHAAEVLTSLGSFVSDLPDNLDKLEQASTQDMDNTSLDQKISDVAQDIVQYKTDFQTCKQTHDRLIRT